MPSRWLLAILALGVLSLIAYACRDPNPRRIEMRLIPGSPGGQTIDFAVAPAGDRIATTSSDGWASLRDLGDDGQLMRILEPRGGLAQGLAFSPDGRKLAVGRAPAGILVFDVAGEGPGIPVDLPLSRIKALTFSPDGRILAASTERDGGILLWDFDASRVRMMLRGRHTAVSLAFSPDGRSLAAGERDERRLMLWDLDTGRARPILEGPTGSVSSVAFSPDGRLLAAASPSDPSVRLWDPRSGALQLRLAMHVGGAVAVGFSPDGGWLATSGNDGKVRIWSVATGEPLAAVDGRSSWLPRVAFSPDGRMLLAAGSDNHLRVWHTDGLGEKRADRPSGLDEPP